MVINRSEKPSKITETIRDLFVQESGETLLFVLKVEEGKSHSGASPRKKFTDRLGSLAELSHHKVSAGGISSGSTRELFSRKLLNRGSNNNASSQHNISSKEESAASLNAPSSAVAASSKKIRYACLTAKASGKIRLHKVKYVAASGQASIGKSWILDDIKSIENVDASDMNLVLGSKSYSWHVENSSDKIEFLFMLIKLCTKNKKSPKLINFNEKTLRDEIRSDKSAATDSFDDQEVDAADETDEKLAAIDDTIFALQSDFGGLNIDEVLRDYNWQVAGDASALEERMSNELLALEAANLHAIIQAEDQSGTVVSSIENSISEMDMIDSWLNKYYNELMTMGKDIQQIESQNKGLQVQTHNQKTLLKEMEDLMEMLHIDSAVLSVLENDSLGSLKAIRKLEDASNVLRSKLQQNFPDGLGEMSAVKERLAFFSRHASSFAERVVAQISKIVSDSTIPHPETRSNIKVSEFKFQTCERLYSAMMPYRKLVGWTKEIDPRLQNELQQAYTTHGSKIYYQSVRNYAEFIRNHLNRKVDENSVFLVGGKGGFFHTPSLAGGIGIKSSSVVSLMQKATHKRSQSVENTAITGESSSPSSATTGKLGKLRGRVSDSQSHIEPEYLISPYEGMAHFLDEITPIMIKEQNFLIEFFHFTSAKPVDQDSSTVLESLKICRTQIPDLKSRKKIDELMAGIFKDVQNEISGYAELACRYDMHAIVSLLVALENAMEKTSLLNETPVKVVESVPFFHQSVQNLHRRLDSDFDRFMEEQAKAIDETNTSLKTRSGILAFVKVFPNFATRMANSLENGSDTITIRKKVNRSLSEIVKIIFSSLEAIAKEVDADSPDDREQLNAHILTIENMHHIYSELRGLKIPTLEPHMKAAKMHYEVHFNAYVKAVVRKPLGKLFTFFEGLEELLKTKQPEEIPYHLNFSKTAVKKCLNSLTGKDLKKALEVLYKRVEKHFCEEEGLLQVVWHGIQEEFLQIHAYFDSLLRKCYAEFDIKLLFTVQDLLNHFSDIARKH